LHQRFFFLFLWVAQKVWRYRDSVVQAQDTPSLGTWSRMKPVSVKIDFGFAVHTAFFVLCTTTSFFGLLDRVAV
jgi:hypothetical protein